MIELNINESVAAAAAAIHAEVKRPEDPEFEDLPAIMKHHLMELGLTVIHALVERGWHSADMHAAVAAAMEEDNKPPTGMDPR